MTVDLLAIPDWLKRVPGPISLTAVERRIMMPVGKKARRPTKAQARALAKIGWSERQIRQLSPEDAKIMLDGGLGPTARHCAKSDTSFGMGR